MSAVSRLKAKYIRRLGELIEVGKRLPMKQHSRQTSFNMLSNESTYRSYDLASWPEFVEWRTSCSILLDQVIPSTSTLRKTVDSFHNLGSEPSKVEFGVAFLKSVRTELENGNLDSVACQIEAEILTDYLDQASTLLGERKQEATFVAAAVVSGAALERGLRVMCSKLDPPEPVHNDTGAPHGLNLLIDALKKRECFNELQAKQLRAWAAIRNEAAHGKLGTFDHGQVNLMVSGIGGFLAGHLGDF